MKIKVTHVGSSSLLGSYVSRRMQNGEGFGDVGDNCDFYIGEIMKDIDLVQEIETMRNVYPQATIRVFNLKYYEKS